MGDAQLRPKRLRSDLTVRALNHPAVWACARALASKWVERIPFPTCIVREPGLEIELSNEAFRRLTAHPMPRGLRDGFHARWGGMLAEELAQTTRSGKFRRRVAEADAEVEPERALDHYDWLFIPCCVDRRVLCTVVVAYDGRRPGARALWQKRRLGRPCTQSDVSCVN